MKNIKKQWFTLVELIVVITILAILWSIAFISLQGYSSDARNSKRTSDLGSITSAMSTQLAQGQSIMSFVTSDTTYRVTTSGSLNIAWTWVTNAVNYEAGKVNYASLPVKAEDFKDPSDNAYGIGVTTNKNGNYELAATIEQWAGAKVAKISWIYSPRGTWASDVVTITTTTASWTSVSLSWSTKVNFFFPGDTVTTTWGGNITTTITKVSSDWTTITLKDSIGVWATALTLTRAEWAGLVRGSKWTAWIVTDGWNALPYSW